MDNDKVKLGVLWSKVSRQGGNKYLTGVIREDSIDAAITLMRQGGRLLILSNKKRPGKEDPDCELFVVPPHQSDASASPPRNNNAARR